MPLNKYFKGHGEEVMRDMKKHYGKDAKKVFYATANKRKSSSGMAGRMEELHRAGKLKK